MRLTPQHRRSSILATSAAAILLFVSACEVKQTQPVSNDTTQQPEQGKTENLPPAPSPPPPAQHEYDAIAKMSAPSSTGALVYRGRQPIPWLDSNTEKYPHATQNPVKVVSEEPVSTFSVDVDTASYSNVRRFLNEGSLPPADAVRVEEMINYFDYAYAVPKDRSAPFEPTVAVYPTPWNKDTQILHIGIKGFDLPKAERPKTNLVFLIDTSGSMQPENKLPLLKRSFRMLVDQLGPKDRVAMVVYAGNAGVVLEPTPGSEKAKILAALDQLDAGGSTAGGEGIRRAYELAEQSFIKDGVNRVILATDGDFNVGITDPNALEDFVTRERNSGVYLTVLGFGEDNYNDLMMQKLAQAGNGTAAYIDTLNEARKVFVEQMSGTLFTIAKDVKIQIEFNPSRVAEYRLIGYETRMLNRTDFNNDKVDAGDIGSGHTVTALYEITPVGSKGAMSDPLRYGKPEAGKPAGNEIAFVKIRYKLPGQDASKLITHPVTDADMQTDFARLPTDMRFAASVAGAAQLLRHDAYVKDFDMTRAIDIAQNAKGSDPYGYRTEFVQLLRSAKTALLQKPLEIRGDAVPEQAPAPVTAPKPVPKQKLERVRVQKAAVEVEPEIYSCAPVPPTERPTVEASL